MYKRQEYDGEWLPLETATLSVPVRVDSRLETRTRAVRRSHHGPVIRTEGVKAFAYKSANLELVDFLTQFNAMAKASTLQGFRAAMQMQQIPMFSVGYADRDGNIWYLFNGRLPLRPAGFDWAGAVSYTHLTLPTILLV